MSTEITAEQIAQARGLTVGQVEQVQRTRGASYEALLAMPAGALQRALRRLEFRDLARARANFEARQARDEHGQIPPNALPTAMRQLDALRVRAADASRVAGVPSGVRAMPGGLVPRTAGLHPGGAGWQALGPGNIGGRTRAIVIHPTTPTTLWAGSAGGGVWRSDDGGQSWGPVDDFMANLAVSTLVIDPTNPDIIYAGTGEGFYNVDSIRGAGLFRTTDGTVWQQLPATTSAEFQYVNRLAISANGRILLAATRNGIFRSDEPDRLSWSKVLDGDISDIDFHPTDSALAVAGGLSNGRAYYSTDGGQSWKIATAGPASQGRVEVTYARANAQVVYASIDSANGQIWRSGDGGRTYTRRPAADSRGRAVPFLGDQGWYDNVIWAGDPTSADLVIVGGVDLWRSTDGGATLRDISTWWDDRSAHADHHCIVADPGYNGTTNRRVYFGNDGGVYKTENVRTVGTDPQPPRVQGWVELVNTYGVTQFYGGAGNVSTGVIIGGAQDNGTLRYTPSAGSESWTSMFGGDGGACAADQSNPNYFYGEYVTLNIHRSSDGGQSAEYISGLFWNGFDWVWKPLPYRIPDARSQDALFIAPFVIDPKQPERLLGGGLSLWRTNNARQPNTTGSGPAWAEIKGSIGARISAIAIAPSNSDIVWVGHEDGQVFTTTNGTAATPLWQKVDHTGRRPLAVNRYCTAIVVAPRNPRTVYVLFGGYSKGNVWRTTTGGTSWTNLGNSLPEAPIFSLAVHPRKSKFVYLGTDVGLFASENGGTTWSPTNEGPTNCSVRELFWMGQTLVCVTHGRGMFSIDLARA